MKDTDKPKRPRGRPVEKPMPEPIPDTPENIARACMYGPPKKEWRYLKKDKEGRPSISSVDDREDNQHG